MEEKIYKYYVLVGDNWPDENKKINYLKDFQTSTEHLNKAMIFGSKSAAENYLKWMVNTFSSHKHSFEESLNNLKSFISIKLVECKIKF